MAVTVKEVMTTSVIGVTPDTSVVELGELFFRHRIGAVPVLGPSRQVLGIVSDGDLMRRLRLLNASPHLRWWRIVGPNRIDAARQYASVHKFKALELMSSPVVTVTEELALSAVVEIFEQHGIKRAPVVRGGKIVGMICRKDVLRAVFVWEGEFVPEPLRSRSTRSAQPSDALDRIA